MFNLFHNLNKCEQLSNFKKENSQSDYLKKKVLYCKMINMMNNN